MSKPPQELTAIAENAGDELQIHYVSLNSLADKFLEGNSKLHSMSDLGDSIARYDFQDPMKFDSSLNGGNGGIVAGNGRLEWLLWAKDAGQAAPRGIRAKDDEWFVPVIFGVEFKDENEAIAFSISHNLSPMWGSDLTFLDQTRLFSEDKLKVQLVGLADLSPNLLPVGLNGDDLDLWLGLNDEPPEPLEEDDEAVNDLIDKAEDGQIESRVKLGEIWACGRHRVACGDSTDEANVRKLLNGKLADCCWTDPPYGVSYVGKTADALTIENDGAKDLPAFIRKSFAAILSALQPGAAVYVAHPPGALQQVFINEFASFFLLRQQLVWVKNTFALGRSDYHYRHEPILFGYTPGGVGRNGRGGERWFGDNSQDSVFEVAKPRRNGEHPTMKPIELIQKMLLNSSGPRSLLFEPFSGSGSTMIAAHSMEGDRTVYGFELSEAYCEVILRRYEALTGETAELVGHI